MNLDRDLAARLAAVDDGRARAMLDELGLLHAEGVADLLAAARAIVRDDPAAAERLAGVVAALAAEFGPADAVPRATYLAAQARAMAGELTAALVLIDEARDGFDRLGLRLDALRTNLGRSQALNEMGRHDDAFAACAEVLDAYEHANDPGEAITELAAMAHQNSGLCLELTGRFEEALQHYGAAKFGYELLHDPQAVAEVTYDRALVLLNLGQHAEALDALRRATTTFREGGFRALQVMALANMAEVLLHRGEYRECLSALDEAAAALEGISSPAGEQVRHLVAGRAYLALNLLPEAHASFDDALRFLAGTDLVIDRARADWGLGVTLARRGRPADAVAALAAAADQFRRSGQSSWLAEVLVDEARLRRTLGDDAGATAAIIEAREVAVAGTPAAATATLLAAELGGWDLDALRVAVDEVQSLGLAPLTAAALQTWGRALAAHGRLPEARDALRHAVDTVEHLRSGLAHELVLTRFLDDKLSPYEDLLQVSIELHRPPQECLAIAEQASSRTLADLVSGLVARSVGTQQDDDLRALYGELFGGDAAADPARAERLRTRVHELESQRGLGRLRSMEGTGPAIASGVEQGPLVPPGETAVVYTAAHGSLHAFVVRDDEVVLHPHLAAVADVEETAAKLGRQWERFRLGNDVVERHLEQLTTAARVLLGRLHDLVWAPLAASWADDPPRAVTIVPDSRLHELPFQALHDGTSWLAETMPVRYAPSLATLRHLPAPAAGTSLLVGVADELAPGVDDEVRSVQQVRPAARALLGAAARWDRVREELITATHLHLSGHALFRPDNPMYSALRLHDGWVTAADVLALELPGRTVVLSACETARTATGSSAEVNGFVRGFLGAGASTVIASQWTADDAATTLFMTELYRRLGRVDSPVALREAMLATAARWPHPYYWAPWIVVGRADPISST